MESCLLWKYRSREQGEFYLLGELPLTPRVYVNLSLSIEVTFDLTNTGKYAGEEVVQLYLHNRYASVVSPVKALKDFRKVFLNPGETKKIRFNINKEKLSYFNTQLNWIANPGEFDLMIGSSSEDIRLKNKFELK